MTDGHFKRPPVMAMLSLLLAATATIYWPGLGGGFAFDDYANIVFNPALHVTSLDWSAWIAATLSSNSSDLQRPIAMFTFAMNHYFTGLSPWPMKLTNVMIHSANALLAFGLVRAVLSSANERTGSSNDPRYPAFAVAAIWALHPINLTAVLFIVQRMESLCHSFVFAGLWLYVSGRQKTIRGNGGHVRAITGLVAFTALGAMCKESAVLLPLYAFLLELFLFKFEASGGKKDRRIAALFIITLFLPAIAGVAWLLPRALAPGAFAFRDFTLFERLLTEPRVVMDYLHWTLAPSLDQLSLYHDDYVPSRSLLAPPATLAGIAVIVALPAIAWACRVRRPVIGLGLAWFLSAQCLTATFLPLELVFEHRNYFASLGLSLVIVDALVPAASSENRRRAGWIIVVALLGVYALTTHLRAREWRDPVSFAISEASKHPLSPRAMYQVGQLWVILSKGDASSPFASMAFRSLENARKLPRSNIMPAQGLLMLAARTGMKLEDAWWQDIDEKLRRRPIGPQELAALSSLTDCAIADRCRFPPDRMTEMFAAALSKGDNPEVLNIYGNYALNVLDDPTLTERLWRESARLVPRNVQYRINLAKLLIAQGRDGEAAAQIAAIRAMGRLGQYEQAARELERRMSHPGLGDRPVGQPSPDG